MYTRLHIYYEMRSDLTITFSVPPQSLWVGVGEGGGGGDFLF